MIVNRAELADVLGVSVVTIDNRIARGLPVERKGREGKSYEFETSDVIDWHVKNQISKDNPQGTPEGASNGSPSDLKQRKLEAETEISELERDKRRIELAEKKKLVVLVEDVVQGFANEIANLRAQLLNLPRRVAPLIVGEMHEDRVKEVLEDEIDILLTELHERALKEAEELNDE